MNVLSLFDGISCGRVALEKVGIKIKKYYASEIDKHAVKIAQKNYPDTIHIGDVQNLVCKDYKNIDLIMGGSPCQSFSIAGNGSGFKGKSGLFWEFIRVLKGVKPKYFLLENVKMKKEWLDIISKELGVEPITINSALVSAQNRVRCYWTNILNVTVPDDRNINLSDLIPGAKGAAKRNQVTKNGIKPFLNIRKDDKSNCLVASYSKKLNAVVIDDEFRPLTPEECEALQTLPIGYTEGASESQRYKMIGNGWTVDVLVYVFENIETI
jgi:DNA (cytosine-5)-methyltransferase 3A